MMVQTTIINDNIRVGALARNVGKRQFSPPHRAFTDYMTGGTALVLTPCAQGHSNTERFDNEFLAPNEWEDLEIEI